MTERHLSGTGSYRYRVPFLLALFALGTPGPFSSPSTAQAQARSTAAGLVPDSVLQEVGPTVWVGTEILVSRDHPTAHVELMAAANPRDSLNLLVGAITMTGPDGGPATRTYVSVDGGQSWHHSSFPEQRRWGGADPQVAFTPSGTALFSTLTTAQDTAGRTRGFLHAYRSVDGGITWSPGSDLGYSYDHPQMVVDHTEGPYTGYAYMAVLHGFPVYTVSVFRSEDDGRTWWGPIEAANGGGLLGINATTPMVLSDGGLIVPYLDFEFRPERRQPGQPSSLWTVVSFDGGATFSAPRLVATRRFNDERGLGGHPQLAADAGSGPFRDHLYAAWVDHEGPDPRIYVSRSVDRGETWSEPQPVDADAPDGSYQFQPAVAVNAEGLVGLTWFDTRGQENRDTFQQMFSASTDGGESWLPPVRVASTPSFRYAPGNHGFTQIAMKTGGDSLRISFLSPAARWSTGGDYMGLTVDQAGRFRPFWTDSRYGSYQIMTTTVEVVVDTSNAETVATEEVDLTADVDVIFDPSHYESDTETLGLLVRIQNAGQREIRSDLKLVVTGFGSGQGTELREFSPTILNSLNGLAGVGAEIDFSRAMGSSRRLLPGEISSPVEVRFRLQDPLRIPDMHVRVRGHVTEGSGF
jgi:hypothetical protein